MTNTTEKNKAESGDGGEWVKTEVRVLLLF